MKIAITGATGGIGQSVAIHFKHHGHQVTALGRNPIIGRDLQSRGIHFLQGDLRDVHYLKTAFSGQDIVIHAAALASPWGPWEDFATANIAGTANVVEAALKSAVSKFVYFSTPSIYFSEKDQLGIKEDQIPSVRFGNYAESKWQAELIVQKASEQHGLPSIILRPPGVFGPNDQVIFPRLIRMLKSGFFPLLRNGSALVDLTVIQNVLQAVELAVQTPTKFYGRAFNISNESPISVKELVQTLGDLLNLRVRFLEVPYWPLNLTVKGLDLWSTYITRKEPQLTKYSLGLLSWSQTLDISRAKLELGYKPKISVLSGIHDFVAHWKGRGN